MRFPKETRALIHQAFPNPVTIHWPAGERQPQEGRIYWLQSKEDAEEAVRKSKARREYSPETHVEVMAGMHRRHYGTEPETKPKRSRSHESAARPKADDPRILVIAAEVLDVGFATKVVLYEDPDSVNHTGLKTRVPAGPNPIDGYQEPAETEPEQLDEPSTHDRRLEEEAAMKLAHKASVDFAEVYKAEKKLLDQRRKGRRSKLKEEAIERAKKRAALPSAAASV